MREPHRRLNLGLAAVAAIALGACSGSGLGGGIPGTSAPAAGGSFLPAASSMQTAQSFSSVARTDKLPPINIVYGIADGEVNTFDPREGDYKDGGNGQVVDGIKCSPKMITNEYHVHTYLGLIYNGKLIALPPGMGMLHPGKPVKLQNGGYYYDSADCFYSIHTHDTSGLVHIEVGKHTPLGQSLFKLKNVLDIWGVPRGADKFGPFKGQIHVFVGNTALGKDYPVTKYKEWKGNLEDIRLFSHTTIFIEIGSSYYDANHLPSVTYYSEY